MSILLTLAAVLVLSAVLTMALRREFARLDEQRQREEALRRFLATNPLALKLKVDFEEMSRQIGERLLPVMVQVTIDASKFTAAMDRMAKTLREVDPVSLAEVAAAEKRIRATVKDRP